MSAGLGDLENIDPDKAIADAQRKAAKLSGMQEELSTVVGRAESSDGHVKAAFSATSGLTELELNPRVMKMASVDLAESIKKVIQEAAQDMQAQLNAQMRKMFEGEGENPMDFVTDPEKSDAKIKEIQDSLGNALNDALTEVEKMRRKLGL